MRRFFFAIAIIIGWCSFASAQTCPGSSGFLTQDGPANIGDAAVFGPDCGHLQDIVAASGGIRTRLSGATTFHVNNSTGVDAAGCGFLTPCRTLQFTMALLCNSYDTAGNSVIILTDNAAVYAENLAACSFVNTNTQGVSTVTVQGQSACTTTIQPASGRAFVSVSNPSGWSLKNFQINAPGSQGVYADGAFIALDGVCLGAATNQINAVNSTGKIEFINNGSTFNAGASTALYTNNGGQIISQALTHSIVGSPTFTQFLFLDSNAVLTLANGTSFGGACTGNKFLVSNGGRFQIGSGVSPQAILPCASLGLNNGDIATSTNDNASTGNIGEFISATVPSGSAIGLTTSVSKNMAGVSIGPGDWDMWCDMVYTGNAATTINYFQASISSASNTLTGIPGDTQSVAIFAGAPALFAVANAYTQKIGPTRFSINTTTTVFCVANASFGINTLSMFGILQGRRIR
jgi:hypothetical protein